MATILNSGFELPSDLRGYIKDARIIRENNVALKVKQLRDLLTDKISKTIYKKLSKDKKKDEKLQVQLEKLNDICLKFFKDDSTDANSKPSKPSKLDIKYINLIFNHFNQLSAELRKADIAKLSPFELFISQNVFPRYDLTNSFQTDDETLIRIEKIGNPDPIVVCEYDGYEISGPELSGHSQDFTLKDSRSNTIYSSNDLEDVKLFIRSLIEKSSEFIKPISPDYYVKNKNLPCKFVRNLKNNNNTGFWYNYQLRFDFKNDRKIFSGSTQMEQFIIRADPTGHLQLHYNEMIKNRLIALISHFSIEPNFTIRVMTCEFIGCNCDVYIYDFARDANMHNTKHTCPSGHPFCVGCYKAEHDGQCIMDQIDEIDKDILSLPGDKKPCPGCKLIIIKDGGCNHMQCVNPRCGQNFCWTCLKRFSKSSQYEHHINPLTNDACNQF